MDCNLRYVKWGQLEWTIMMLMMMMMLICSWRASVCLKFDLELWGWKDVKVLFDNGFIRLFLGLWNGCGGFLGSWVYLNKGMCFHFITCSLIQA